MPFFPLSIWIIIVDPFIQQCHFFFLLEPPLCLKDWFSTQYLLVRIITLSLTMSFYFLFFILGPPWCLRDWLTQYPSVWIIAMDHFYNNVIFLLSIFFFVYRDWFSTQYLSIWIIVVVHFLQQCHFLFLFFLLTW